MLVTWTKETQQSNRLLSFFMLVGCFFFYLVIIIVVFKTMEKEKKAVKNLQADGQLEYVNVHASSAIVCY